MSAPTTARAAKAAPAPNAAPAPKATAAVIRRTQGAEETPRERLVRKQLPAWVISGAVHIALVATLILADMLLPRAPAAALSDAQLTVVAPTEEKEVAVNLVNEQIGLDPTIPTAIEADKLAEVNVQIAVQATDSVGVESASPTNPMVDIIPPPGAAVGNDAPGVKGDLGFNTKGMGAGGDGVFKNEAFNGRGAGTRSKLVAMQGGNSESEAAVARCLIWIAKQQKANGSWVYDGDKAGDVTAATGMALLPFLAAGQTHKSASADNKYKANVTAGTAYLLSNQEANGHFKTSHDMYSHAIATIALCELLGMTGDSALLSRPCQLAVNYIVKAQAPDGSWGYSPNRPGDTSIVGWQLQALHSARLCKNLTIDVNVLKKAMKFLDSVAGGTRQSRYGYNSPPPGGSNAADNQPSLTAVGLLCRYYVDGWGPQQPGMVAGVKHLLDTRQPNAEQRDMYYYYYATQVLHFFGGDEWDKTWNPKMRDLLVQTQAKEKDGATSGSWAPDASITGNAVGRLGYTCMAVLTLEVYYRHLPTYKRTTGALTDDTLKGL